MDALRGGAGSTKPGASARGDSPEALLDVFKAAARSVTNLYKASALAESKARSDGYQDCLEDLLAFLDKENIGLGDGEASRIRRWVTDRVGGRDLSPQAAESEDEVDTNNPSINNTAAYNSNNKAGSAPPSLDINNRSEITSISRLDDASTPHAPAGAASTAMDESYQITVPTQDTFMFQSSHPYPNIATLELSDTRSQENMGGINLLSPPTTAANNNANTAAATTATSSPTPNRMSRLQRHTGGIRSRNDSRSSTLGRGAGLKRKLNIAEIFDLGSLGGKDVFGGNGGTGSGGGKRSRHA